MAFVYGDVRGLAYGAAGVVAYLGLLALTFIVRFRSGAWERIELVPEPTL